MNAGRFFSNFGTILFTLGFESLLLRFRYVRIRVTSCEVVVVPAFELIQSESAAVVAGAPIRFRCLMEQLLVMPEKFPGGEVGELKNDEELHVASSFVLASCFNSGCCANDFLLRF
jgi:hypothetical protein